MTTTLAHGARRDPTRRHEPPRLELAELRRRIFRWLLILAAVAIPILLGFLVFELWDRLAPGDRAVRTSTSSPAAPGIRLPRSSGLPLIFGTLASSLSPW
jgi:hypothetical protein